MAYKGRYDNGSKSPKSSGGVWKTVLIIILSVVLILALILGGAVYFINSFINSKLGKVTQAEFVEKDVSGQDLSGLIGNLDESNPSISIDEPTTEATTEPTEPDYGESGKIVNILVIGQDSREGEEAKLADAIILCTLNKETRTLSTTSFLRDSYVKLADYRGHTCGWNRINTAYALGYSWHGDAGAMEMLNLTLKNNYGVQVDGNVELSFSTFKKIVNAVGGVEVDLQGAEYTKMLHYQELYNATHKKNPVELHEGVNTLNGYMALGYVRERHIDDADNDIKRTARQRKVMLSLLDKVSSLGVQELNDLIDVVLSEIITDISTDDMKMYIRELTPYLLDLNLESYQIPAEGTYWGEMVKLPDGEGGVLKIDFTKNQQVVAAIQNGEEVPTFK